MSKNKKAISGKYWMISLLFSVIVLSIGFITFGETNNVQAEKLAGSPFIYDNAGLATGITAGNGTTAPTGFQWSELQKNANNDSNTILGAGCQLIGTTTNNRCADDFTVPSGQTWTITQVVEFAYQTGFAGTTSPFIGANLRIWDGVPGSPGSNIIFGDSTTNRLASSPSADLYRIGNTLGGNGGVAMATAGTTRRVWQMNMSVSPPLVLSAGTYWIDFQFDAGASGSFVPLATIVGNRSLPGWNARQFIGTISTWQDVIDIGEPGADPQPNVVPDVQMDFPFKLVGSVATASPQPPQVDFDGDGKSDYSIVRNETPPGTATSLAPAGRRSIQELQANPGFKALEPVSNNVAPADHGTNLVWYISNSGSNTARVQGFGQPATDFWVPEDYDGDGKDDIAVWRGVASSGPNGGFFYTFTSSNNTVNEINFGVIGDNPTVVGDYDGDGIADPAVYRQPGSAPFGQTSFYFRGSNNNPNGNITFVQWGNNIDEDLRPYPGDFDGDGKNDFCIFRTNPNNTNQGQYVLLKSSNGGIEYINWGLNPQNEPALAPGDYDGDGKTDFMNVRVSGSTVQWWLLDRNGNQSTTNWGAVGSSQPPAFGEFITPGDFDGDGATDISVWRRDNNNNSNSFFYTLRSSDGMLQTFKWGAANDAPVPGWNVN